jgi:hypothetical protein
MMTTTLIFMIAGVGLGLSFAYAIRRYQAFVTSRRPVPPPSFASRQDQRKYERQLQKQKESERKLQERRDKGAKQDL